jgi:hypothetical protein
VDRVVELDREPVFRRGALAEVKVEAERDDDAFSPLGEWVRERVGESVRA